MRFSLIIALLIACGGGKDAPSPGSASGSAPAPEPTTPVLRVGATLHPYYSWTANVVAGVPGFEVVSVLPGEVDAGSYQPSPDDIAKIGQLDALVVNGIGHDDFIKGMIEASGNKKLVVIPANSGTPLIKYSRGDGKNSHSFISFTNAIQQTRLIAKKLGELRPAVADKLRDNASAYAEKLRAIQAKAAKSLQTAKIRKVVTVHDGYSYLLQEFGIELAGVVQPSHGLVPSAKELGEMIDLMKTHKVQIVFTEEDFPEKLLATLREATQAKVYVISHVATGAYTADKFEKEMQANADQLVKALASP